MHINWFVVHPKKENVTAKIIQRPSDISTALVVIYIDGIKKAGHYAAIDMNISTIYYLMGFYIPKDGD